MRSMVPTVSCPGTNANVAGRCPVYCSWSVPHRPHASTRSTASSSETSGIGKERSSRRRGDRRERARSRLARHSSQGRGRSLRRMTQTRPGRAPPRDRRTATSTSGSCPTASSSRTADRPVLLRKASCRPATTCRATTSGWSCSTPTDTSSHCPFKGDATYWSAAGVPDVAWSYADTRPGGRADRRAGVLLQREGRHRGRRSSWRSARRRVGASATSRRTSRRCRTRSSPSSTPRSAPVSWACSSTAPCASRRRRSRDFDAHVIVDGPFDDDDRAAVTAMIERVRGPWAR